MEKRNKERKEENTTISVSMSRELKKRAELLSKDMGAENMSALVRILLTNALKDKPASTGGEGAPQDTESEVANGSPIDPTSARPRSGDVRRAGRYGFGLRKKGGNL